MSDMKFKVTLEGTAEFDAATKRLDDEVRKIGKGAGAAGAESKSFGQQLTGNLIPAFTAATIAADIIRGGFHFLKDEIGETIAAAIEAEKIDRALESSLQIVGQAAGGTAETLKRYASALQRKTKYDDEAIKSAQALIIQMRGTVSQVDVLTKGAIGLASVFDMDLQSAARAVTQGFEGNYRAIGMMIPAVRQATTDGEKHAAMMDFLGGAYKRAESEVTTFEGKVGLVKKAYNELQETAGELVIQNKSVLASLEGIKSIIEWLDMQAKKSEAGGKKASVLDYFGPVALWHSLSSVITATGKSAQKAIDDFAKSWEGYTASFLAMRGVALDPIPIIIQEKLIRPLAESQLALAEEVRWLRMLGSMSVWAPIRNNFGSLGAMVGGGLESVIDFQETVPGLFEALNTGVAKLTPAMQAQIASAEAMKEVWNTALGTMLASAVSFGDGTGSIFKGIGEVYANFIKSAIAGIEMLALKEIWAATMTVKSKKTEALASHIANIFKSVPFPLDLVLAAGAFAVVNSLFSKILKFEKGGFAERPIIAEIGHGPEYVLPEPRLEQLIERTIIRERTLAPAGGGHGGALTINMGVHIKTNGLSDSEIHSAGNRIFREMEAQARLRGFKLRNA
jgi:hypothetical protein